MYAIVHVCMYTCTCTLYMCMYMYVHVYSTSHCMQESVQPAEGSGGGGVSSLLSRWREKVFVLMVQSKLQLMEQGRMRQQAQQRVSSTHQPCTLYNATHVHLHTCTCMHIHIVMYLINGSIGKPQPFPSVQEADLLGQVSQVERERELLSHTLTDRTAQLQLQLSKTEVQCTCSVYMYMYSVYIQYMYTVHYSQ